MTTDASNFAIGAVLSQGPIGSDRPVAYASRTLSDTEIKYSTIEKELLAIIWATKHFRPYLYGNKFTIYTDHRPLAWLYSLKEPNSKLTRWRLRLEEFDFEIKYKKGTQNTNADALPRIRINAIEDDLDSIFVNVDDSDERVQEVRKELENALKNEHKEKIETIVLSDSDEGNESSLEELSDDGVTANSISNRELDGIPILNEAIDNKPKQILVFTWFKNELSVKDISNNKQRILEVHLPNT